MGTPAYYYSSTAGSYTLTGSISSSATSLTLNSVTGLPSSLPYKVVLDPGQVSEEIVKVTAVAGMSLTVVRGWDGSSAASHAAGATVRHMMTAEDLTLSRNHEAATAAHGVAGNVVGTSDTQALTNKDLTGAGNVFPTSLVSLTTAQALTNKDLTSATNTFPTTLVTLAGTQTLTAKTLTSPTINGGTISSANLATGNTFPTKFPSAIASAPSAPADGGFSTAVGTTIPAGSGTASFECDAAGWVHGHGMFGYTTGQGTVSSRDLGALIPASMVAATARGSKSFIVRFHCIDQPSGTAWYGDGLLIMDPHLNTASIQRADGKQFSWAGGGDNWISLDQVLFNIT